MGKLRLVPFRAIEDPTKLRRVLEATLLIEANLELPEVLRHVVEEARSMTGARYGALGVLDEDKQSLSEFITVGLTEEEEAQIGAPPDGPWSPRTAHRRPAAVAHHGDRRPSRQLRLPAEPPAHDVLPRRADQGA